MRAGVIIGERGFTLVEVLAALLVFSISIIGLTHAGTESAKATFLLEQKMLASIVADNQLVLARRGDVVTGAQTGKAQQKGREFDWRVETMATDAVNFYRINVTVRSKDEAQILIDRTAFRTGPTQAGVGQ